MNYLLQLLGLEQSHDVARIFDGEWRFSRALPDAVLVALIVGTISLVRFIFARSTLREAR